MPRAWALAITPAIMAPVAPLFAQPLDETAVDLQGIDPEYMEMS
jgi:hypothetical protein